MGMKIFLVMGWQTNRAAEIVPTHSKGWNTLSFIRKRSPCPPVGLINCTKAMDPKQIHTGTNAHR